MTPTSLRPVLNTFTVILQALRDDKSAEMKNEIWWWMTGVASGHKYADSWLKAIEEKLATLPEEHSTE